MRHDVGPRHHDLGDLLRGEVEDLVEHLLLGLLELTDVLRRGDRVTDVLTRVREHPRGCGLDAQQTEHGVRRHLQQPHDRMRQTAEEVERDGEHDGERLRLLQRHRLGHELAEHDREVREDREGDQEAHARRQRRLHQIRDQRLADRTDEDREDRDAELRARDEPNRLVHEPQGGSGATATAEGALLEPRPSRGDERVLRRDEHRAPQYEEKHDEDAEKDAHAPSGAPVLGGLSSPTMIRRQYR